MDLSVFSPNSGKARAIDTAFGRFDRYPIRTHVIMRGERIEDVMQSYTPTPLLKGDYLFVSEKIVAICQGRAWDISEIKPSRLAKLLSRFVYRSPYGIGLGSPWTMQLAIEEVGVLRLLFAAACSALTKPFGVRGVFYRIAGTAARAIDGPCDCTIPPYNHYAKKAPKDPDRVARRLAGLLGCGVVIIDANDLGVEVLGKSSSSIPTSFCKQVFRDNPLGQSHESTPLCVVRRVS